MQLALPIGFHPYPPGTRVQSRDRPGWGEGIVELPYTGPFTRIIPLGAFVVRWGGDFRSYGQAKALDLISVPSPSSFSLPESSMPLFPVSLVSLATTLRAERERWVQAAADWTASPVLVGQAYVAYIGGLALRRKDNLLIPTRALPGVSGIDGASHYTQMEATRIAEMHGGGYRAVHYQDVARARIGEIDEMLDMMETQIEVVS